MPSKGAELDQCTAAENDRLAGKITNPFDVAGAPQASRWTCPPMSSSHLAHHQDYARKNHDKTSSERHVSPMQFATFV
jgi:hypothetical protein